VFLFLTRTYNTIDERSTSAVNLVDDNTGSLKFQNRKRASSASYFQPPVVNSISETSMEDNNPMLRQLLQEVDTAKLYVYCEEVRNITWKGVCPLMY